MVACHYTDPSIAGFAEALRGIASTGAESNNTILSRQKLHANLLGYPTSQLWMIDFADSHNDHVVELRRRAKKSRDNGALGPKRLRPYAFDGKLSCFPRWCWGYPACPHDCRHQARNRFPMPVVDLDELSPLIIRSEDGSVPALRCTGLNNFALVDIENYGFVRNVVGHRTAAVVVTNLDDIDGSQLEVARLEVLVDWHDSGGRQWRLSWEAEACIREAAPKLVQDYRQHVQDQRGKPLEKVKEFIAPGVDLAKGTYTSPPALAGSRAAAAASSASDPPPLPAVDRRGGFATDGRTGDIPDYADSALALAILRAGSAGCRVNSSARAAGAPSGPASSAAAGVGGDVVAP